MSLPNFVSGYVYDKARIDEHISEMTALGLPVLGSQQPALPGTWQRMKGRGHTGIFLRDRELVVWKKYHRPYLQRFGTCVSRGTARGVQTSMDVAVSMNSLLKPVRISFAPIYTLARHEVGRDRCGRGDGAILADAMRAVHDFGVATNDLFPGTSEDDTERIAVKYAAPGVGTPSSWISACSGHTCVAFSPETLELIFDTIAAGYAVPYAMSYITGQPNSKGISDLGSYGPHCRCFTGVFVDENGDDQLESSESWGRFPAGDPEDVDQAMPVDQIPRITIRYAGGEKQLAPGCVGVNAKRFYEQIQQNGEAWGVGPAKFAASGIAEILNAGASV